MRNCCKRFVLLIVLGVVFFVGLNAQIAEISELGVFYSNFGTPRAYQSSGDYAYVLFKDDTSYGYNLLVFLVEGASAPHTECMISLPMPNQQNYYRDLALDGQRLAVVADKLILIYDISNPTEPVLSSSQPCQGNMLGAVIVGDYLITNQSSYLRAYAINTPGVITLTDSLYVGYVQSIHQLHDDKVIISGNPCKVFQISFYGTFNEPLTLNLTYAEQLAGTWNNLVFTKDWLSVCVYDVSDLNNPIYLYYLPNSSPSFIGEVCVLDGYLVMKEYVEIYHDTINWTTIYNISGSQANLVGTGNAEASDIFLSDGSNRMFRSSMGKISFIEVSDTPVYGESILNCNMNLLSAESNALYLGMGSYVQFIEPTLPATHLATIDVERVSMIAVKDDLLVTSSYERNPYVEDWDDLPNKIRLWDVSNPAAPELLSYFTMGGPVSYKYTTDIRFCGDTMMLLSESGIVSLFNISNPLAPVSLGNTISNGNHFAADLSSSNLFLAYSNTSSHNLSIYQLHEVGEPELIANLNLLSYVTKLDEVDGMLYLLTGHGHIMIYNVTNPAYPLLISDTNIGVAPDFVVQDDDLVTLGNSILKVYRIVPAGLSELVASHIIPISATRLGISGNTVLVLDGNRLIYLDCTEAFSAALSNSDTVSPIPDYRLSVYPNPFGSVTNISIALPVDQDLRGKPQTIDLVVYNLRGQVVRTLAQNAPISKQANYSWDGRSNKGETCSRGIYVLKLSVNGEHNYIKKITLLQ